MTSPPGRGDSEPQLEKIARRIEELHAEVRELSVELRRQTRMMQSLSKAQPMRASAAVLCFGFVLALCFAWGLHWAIALGAALLVGFAAYSLFRPRGGKSGGKGDGGATGAESGAG